MQLNFSNCIQDVNNVIGIVRANREDSKESLGYLEKALDVYNKAISACKDQIELNFELSDIDKFLLCPFSENNDEKAFEKRIHGGINIRVLETNLTQTYFYMAQVY